MARLAYVIGLLLMFSIPTFAAKKILTVKAVTHQAEVREYKTSYTLPGSPGYSNTNCMGNATGNATDFGNTTSIYMNGNVDCHTTTTAPTPPETKYIRISRGFVTNIVEGEGFRYTIQCTANWVGSNCVPLIDGESFPAEIDGATMWLRARRGGNQGKLLKIKYKIVDIRPTAPSYSPASQPPKSALREAYLACGESVSINVWSSPILATSQLVEGVRCGEKVEILEESAGWFKIRIASGKEGYVAARWIADRPTKEDRRYLPTALGATVAKGPASPPVPQAAPQTSVASPAPEPVPTPTPAALTSISHVVIKSTPEGAEITIDGKFVGSTPSTVRLDPGDHEIVIEKKGANIRRVAGGEVTLPTYRAWRRTLTVNPGSTLTVDAALETVR